LRALNLLPAVLIIDNAKQHFTMGVWKKCRDAGLFLVGLPPRTTSGSQPLDNAVFKYARC
jgi:transposase